MYVRDSVLAGDYLFRGYGCSPERVCDGESSVQSASLAVLHSLGPSRSRSEGLYALPLLSREDVPPQR